MPSLPYSSPFLHFSAGRIYKKNCTAPTQGGVLGCTCRLPRPKAPQQQPPGAKPASSTIVLIISTKSARQFEPVNSTATAIHLRAINSYHAKTLENNSWLVNHSHGHTPPSYYSHHLIISPGAASSCLRQDRHGWVTRSLHCSSVSPHVHMYTRQRRCSPWLTFQLSLHAKYSM